MEVKPQKGQALLADFLKAVDQVLEGSIASGPAMG
jgi:hypothetical protein